MLLLAFRPAVASEDPAQSALQKMSLREKVGQLFLVGFPQRELDQKLARFIETQKPGGFILFRRNLQNFQQIRSFNQDLTKKAQVQGFPPLIAVDQEGGSVTRIPLHPSLPSALAVGLSGRSDLAKELSRENGLILRRLGFNLNLAPVLDLSNPRTESFIGSRSFGPDPDQTAELGLASALGMQEAGILPTGKHFPGLGSTAADPHLKAITKTHDLERIRSQDLKPFEQYARSLGSFSALMVSQLSYPALDPSGLPAPFSKKILTDLLRNELQYPGLVITDDLQMAGSATVFPAREAALQSLRAGADIVMITWSSLDQTRAMRRVEEAVQKGEWTVAALDEKVLRILRAKQSLKQQPPLLLPPLAKSPLGIPTSPRLQALDLELLDAKVLSVARRPAGADGFNLKQPCVLSTEHRFSLSFEKGLGRRARRIPLTQQTAGSKDLFQKLGQCSVIVSTLNGKRSSKVLNSFSESLQRKTVVVNFGPASLLKEGSWAMQVELAHSHLHAGHRVAELLKNSAVALNP